MTSVTGTVERKNGRSVTVLLARKAVPGGLLGAAPTARAVLQLGLQGREEAFNPLLSKQSPMDPSSRAACLQESVTERPLVWVEPWSLWWTGPGARCRLQIAIRNALTIDWERVWSPIDQPTTRARSSRSPSRSRASRRWCGAVDVGEIGPVRCLGPEGPLDQVIGGCAGPLAEQGQCTPCSQLCRDRLDGAAGDSKPLHRTSFAWTRRLRCCRRNWLCTWQMASVR